MDYTIFKPKDDFRYFHQMKPESIASIKKELKDKSREELEALCLRIAKYKVENKELLSFLLFHESNVWAYNLQVKEEMDLLFDGINNANLYWAKKSIRKILRLVNKHIKYVSEKETEIELLIYFCEKLKSSEIPFQKSTALFNIYERQLVKIEKAITTLHEDLQYDWNLALDQKNLRLSYF